MAISVWSAASLASHKVSLLSQVRMRSCKWPWSTCGQPGEGCAKDKLLVLACHVMVQWQLPQLRCSACSTLSIAHCWCRALLAGEQGLVRSVGTPQLSKVLFIVHTRPELLPMVRAVKHAHHLPALGSFFMSGLLSTAQSSRHCQASPDRCVPRCCWT